MSLLRGTGARLAAGATLALLALSGCSATPAVPPATVSASATPTRIFASDEEALAAAKKAYGRYLEVSDAVSQDGGAEPDRYRSVAAGRALVNAFKSADQFQEAKARSVGSTKFNVYEVQAISMTSDLTLVTLYICEDVSGVDVVRADGKSLVSADRALQLPFSVEIALERTRALLNSKVLWKGSNFC